MPDAYVGPLRWRCGVTGLHTRQSCVTYESHLRTRLARNVRLLVASCSVDSEIRVALSLLCSPSSHCVHETEMAADKATPTLLSTFLRTFVS